MSETPTEAAPRNDIIDECEIAVDNVIDGCREEGEVDLRAVKARIHTAFCLLRTAALPASREGGENG